MTDEVIIVGKCELCGGNVVYNKYTDQMYCLGEDCAWWASTKESDQSTNVGNVKGQYVQPVPK